MSRMTGTHGSARPDQKMSRRIARVTKLGVFAYSSAQRAVVKKQAAKKRRQRDKLAS